MPRRSHGPSRRALLHGLLAAAGGLSLPGLLKLRAAGGPAPRTAVIFVQLGGGASQFETYDPKPDAPAEYRGPLRSVPTSVPGVRFCEALPRQAQLMRELAIVRSIRHQEASHIALHVVETGYFLRDARNARAGEMPSVGAVVTRARGPAAPGLPAAVNLPRAQAYSGTAHLGRRYAPFDVDGDPSTADFRVGNLTLARGLTHDVLHDRQALLSAFDEGRRVLDVAGDAEALGAFRREALELVTGEQARRAFDLDREPSVLRDRYGRNPFGQRLLLARRLVEAGVPFVTVRTFDWDDHQGLADKLLRRAPSYDAGMAALIADLRERGMHRDVLVVAMGEFGRTPRVNRDAGRDHWPAVMSVLLAGGGYRMGQVIGASDARGASAAQAPYHPQNILALVYRHLGIDPALTFNDHTGRPRHLLEEREPIRELL